MIAYYAPTIYESSLHFPPIEAGALAAASQACIVLEHMISPIDAMSGGLNDRMSDPIQKHDTVLRIVVNLLCESIQLLLDFMAHSQILRVKPRSGRQSISRCYIEFLGQTFAIQIVRPIAAIRIPFARQLNDGCEREYTIETAGSHFRTTSSNIISDIKADGIYTAGTRIYKAFSVNDVAEKDPVIIKDYWPGEKYETEDVTRRKILDDIMDDDLAFPSSIKTSHPKDTKEKKKSKDDKRYKPY